LDFTDPVSTVSIDAVANSDGDYGRLEIYNSNDELLARYTTQALLNGAKETMTLSRGEMDIAYAIARSHGKEADGSENGILLDNLEFGAESTATTDAYGSYALPYLEAGTYTVEMEVGAEQASTSPAAGKRTVSVATGQAVSAINFGLYAEPGLWQNPVDKYDVNADGNVSPIDVLQIVNDLNTIGPRQLADSDPVPPPYLDVTGDGYVVPGDVLMIIDELNRRTEGAGETDGEAPQGGAAGGGPAEAESTPIHTSVFAASDFRHMQARQTGIRGTADVVARNTALPLAGEPRVEVSPADELQAAQRTLGKPSTLPRSELSALEAALDDLAVDISQAWLSARSRG
jgi:hypothetical protein